MSLIIGKLYAKLRLATVPGGKAIAAVEEAALFDKIFVESRLLFWMAAFNLALTLITAFKVFSQ
jgi:hypothetical protein